MTDFYTQAILKQKRDQDRRFLKARGWKAVPALKSNGSFVWRYITAGRKKAYSRQEAVRLAKKNND